MDGSGFGDAFTKAFWTLGIMVLLAGSCLGAVLYHLIAHAVGK